MSVTGVSSNTSTVYGMPDPSAADYAGNKAKILDVNDFMKLLATQFAMQDPMKPMDDTAFIAQTAQFTGLQQTSTLVQQMTQLSAQQNLANANSFLGRQVTVDTGNGVTDVGQVTAVDASGKTPQVIINGKAYDVARVIRVETAPLSTNIPTPPSPTEGS
jgi:flagellar basal-body rod modification protein FlgD